MKKHFLFFSLLILNISLVQGQTKRISFNYDDAGNQTKRWICVGCNARVANDTIPKTIETVTEKDMIEDEEYKQISYYPNPVIEELYIKWINDDVNFVSSIELYTMTGQLMKRYDDLGHTDIAVISFRNYPEGFYNLILIYGNGDRKTLKIVKK